MSNAVRCWSRVPGPKVPNSLHHDSQWTSACRLSQGCGDDDPWSFHLWRSVSDEASPRTGTNSLTLLGRYNETEV